MKIIRSIAVMALALAASACATNWVKPGTSEQDLVADTSTCEQEAEAAFANVNGRLERVASSLDKRGAFDRCMIAHGWRDKQGRVASVQPTSPSRTEPPLYLPGYSR